MQRLRKYIRFLKSSDEDVKHYNAMIFATFLTAVFVVVYIYIRYDKYILPKTEVNMYKEVNYVRG